MHLLAARPGAIDDGSQAVDLGQTPGDIVILSAADSELAALAQARAGFADSFPTLRLANPMHLGHNLSVDIYVEGIIAQARLVVLRLLGGVGYWPYGIEQVAECCRRKGIPLAVLPGDDQPDAELAGLCSLPRKGCHRLWQYCVHGGPGNLGHLRAYAASLIEPNMTLLLDCGSTVIYAAKLISARPLQVVTNSLAVANLFHDDEQVELLLVGGNLVYSEIH